MKIYEISANKLWMLYRNRSLFLCSKIFIHRILPVIIQAKYAAKRTVRPHGDDSVKRNIVCVSGQFLDLALNHLNQSHEVQQFYG